MKKYVRSLPFLALLAALVAYGGLMWQGPQGLSELTAKRGLAERLERENADLDRENREKQEHIDKLIKDRSTIEIEIRKRLRMKKPGETLFESTTPVPAATDSSPAPADSASH